jgi:hypothetical protein
MPETDISILVRATITTDGGATFSPALPLRLSPLQLALAGTPTDLHVRDATTTAQVSRVPRMVSVQHRQLQAGLARRTSAAMLALALVTAVGVVFLVRREPRDEASRILRRWGSLLVRVLPPAADDRGSVVDVPEFAVLVKLAENNASLILHWSSGNVATYVVQAEGTTYRFRNGVAKVGPTPVHDVQGWESVCLTS